MSLLLVASERFVEHQTPPGHPESPERAEVFDAIASEWRARGGEVVAPPEVTREQLARVHSEGYLRRIEETAGQAVALDADTYTSPETFEIARRAAGAAVDAVERVMANGGSALALVRPPGHHAERNRAMGFCLYNNVAVAAAHARTLGAARIAIVDYDVHHGNGTQHIFETDPAVLYVSTHQFPFYPGTGAADEIGRDGGRGFTVNLPMEVGAVDEDYEEVFAAIVLPILRQFNPDLILISAGVDAHERDPLAGMRLTTPAFGAMTAAIREVAIECCEGRLVAVTEGGYDLRALGQSLMTIVSTLAASATAPVEWPTSSPGIPPRRGRAAAAAAKAHLGPFWQL
jgi:acetoin utilization deacetylase AcuC-like enzyme